MGAYDWSYPTISQRGRNQCLRIHNPDQYQNTSIHKWSPKNESTIEKALPEDEDMIKTLDPFLDPPFGGGSCDPVLDPYGPFLGLWAAAGSESL